MALAAFARQVNAITFFYGGPDPSFPPPLTVVSGPGATGSQTLTVSGGAVTTSDGRVIQPLATTAPVSVGTAGNQETVTPSAVSNNLFSNLYGPSATFTATFANAHYAGDRVASGTCGLQEAINYCKTLGGTVVIDSSWVLYGGTESMIQNATFPGGVSLLDNRGLVNAAGPLKTNIVLTNTQILNLSSTAVQILPAPGAGYFYNIIKATVVNENLGTAYAAGGAITIGYGPSNAIVQGLSGTIAASFLTTPTVTQVIQLAGVNVASSTEAQYDNQPIFINNASGNFTTGAGTLRVSLVYTIENK